MAKICFLCDISITLPNFSYEKPVYASYQFFVNGKNDLCAILLYIWTKLIKIKAIFLKWVKAPNSLVSFI